jgi:hypothetical protein
MTGKDLADAFGSTLTTIAIVCFAVGVLLTLLITVGIPALWGWLKPFIHTWTA